MAQVGNVDISRDLSLTAGPTVVEILNDKRPVRRRLGFYLIMVRMLFPQSQMTEDARYYVRFMDEADDLHFVAASGAVERVLFPNTRLRGHKLSL